MSKRKNNYNSVWSNNQPEQLDAIKSSELKQEQDNITAGSSQPEQLNTNKSGNADINNSDNSLAHQQVGRPIIRRVKPARATGERKTRRLNLLIRPTTAEQLEELAYNSGQSLNDLINDVCEAYLSKLGK
ncbi:MAG: hypothetical protein IJ725_03985 [Ruminococcus sp.]|nr:hypothetical protein [Ruminococcus sp.]